MKARHRARLRSADKAIARAKRALDEVWREYQSKPYGSYWETRLRASDLAEAYSRLEAAEKRVFDLLYPGRR